MQESAFPLRPARAAVGCLAILLAVGYTTLGLRLSRGALDEPGPGIFPLVVGPLLGIAGLAVVLEAARGGVSGSYQLPQGRDLGRLLAVVGLFAAYLVALPHVGYLISSVVLVFGLMRALSDRPWPWLLAFALGASGVTYWLFAKLLHVVLPRGLLVFW